MKKKLLICLIVGLFKVNCMFGQGYPVLDVANLMQSIESVYQYYQQIQNTIEQVQNTYTQIEQAAKQMAEMDWSSITNFGDNFSDFSSNPFETISKVKTSASDIKSAVETNMGKVNKLKAELQAENISFGGMSVSVADLCGAGDPEKDIIGFSKNAWDATIKAKDEAIKGYVGKLTYEQKVEIVKRYGMDADTYASIQLANYQLNELVKDANVSATITAQKKLLEDCENDANAIQTLAKNLPDGSVFAATQLVSSSLAQAERQLGNMHQSIVKGFGLFSEYITSEKTKEAVLENKKQQELLKEKKQLETSGLDDISLDLF